MKAQVMRRAWEIYRTLEGDRAAKLSIALRRAWAEIKASAKKVDFEGWAKVAKEEDADRECEFFTFKSWSKNNKKRIYINDYKRRTIGYIDQNDNNNIIIMDRQGNYQWQIDYAINQFTTKYTF